MNRAQAAPFENKNTKTNPPRVGAHEIKNPETARDFLMVELIASISNLASLFQDLERPADPTEESAPDQGVRVRRQVQHRLPADQVEALLSGYRGGDTVYELAKRFAIDRRTVSAILQRHGVPRRYNLLGPGAIEEAVRLYQAGLSLARVGQRFDVDAGTVLNAFRKAGVETRPRSGASRSR